MRLARGVYPSDALRPVAPELSDREVLEKILCIHQPHAISPVIMEYTVHEKISAVLAKVVGAHLPPAWWDGSVKCMQSMYFAKAPGKPGQAWHQDEIYIPTRDRSLCGAWIAIDDASIDNGCLWVLPGSHRSGKLFDQRPSDNNEYDFAPESYGFADDNEIPVEVPSGSVVFFNGYLLHRSRKNRSQKFRRALVSHYMTAQSRLPWGQMAGGVESVAQADCRSIHMVSGKDPYPEKETSLPSGVHLRAYEKKAALELAESSSL